MYVFPITPAAIQVYHLFISIKTVAMIIMFLMLLAIKCLSLIFNSWTSTVSNAAWWKHWNNNVPDIIVSTLCREHRVIIVFLCGIRRKGRSRRRSKTWGGSWMMTEGSSSISRYKHTSACTHVWHMADLFNYTYEKSFSCNYVWRIYKNCPVHKHLEHLWHEHLHTYNSVIRTLWLFNVPHVPSANMEDITGLRPKIIAPVCSCNHPSLHITLSPTRSHFLLSFQTPTPSFASCSLCAQLLAVNTCFQFTCYFHLGSAHADITIWISSWEEIQSILSSPTKSVNEERLSVVFNFTERRFNSQHIENCALIDRGCALCICKKHRGREAGQ